MPANAYQNTATGFLGGHYQVGQRSGEIAATLAALGHLARIRWAPTDSSKLCVLKRIRVGWSVSADITSGKIEMAFRAIQVRQFTTDFTTAMTLISLAGGSNRLRSTMNPSLMGTSGPGICTTAVLSGQTLTADQAPFGVVTTAPLVGAVSATGTATLATQGMTCPMATLYEQGADGFHPVILGNNEGVVVQNVLAGPASGTFAVYVEWSWAEVPSF